MGVIFVFDMFSLAAKKFWQKRTFVTRCDVTPGKLYRQYSNLLLISIKKRGP